MVNQSFPDQRPDEEVLLVFRRHIFALYKGFFGLIILSILAFIPYLIVPSNQTLLWLGLAGVLVGLLVLFYHWIGWYFTVYILTNQRIRQNSQKGLFSKSVVDVGLDKIQSAFVKISGVAANLFKYGTIILHTQVGDMIINKVSQPEQVYAKLQEEIGKVEYKGQTDDEQD